MRLTVSVAGHDLSVAIRPRSASDPTLMLDYYLPNGRRRRIATGTEDPAEAKSVLQSILRDMENEVHAAILMPHTVPGEKDPKIGDLADWYVKQHLPYLGRAPRSIAKYASTLRDFETFCKTRHVGRMSQLNMARIQEYVTWRDGYRKRAAKTTHGAISIIRAWIHACVDAGHLSAAPVRKWILPKLPEPAPRALSAEQLERLLRIVKEHEPSIYPAVLFAAHSGFRISDLLGLCWGEVEADRIRRVQIKTGRAVVIPITPPLREALDAMRPADGQPKRDAPCFPFSDRTLLRKLSAAAKAGDFEMAVHAKLLRTTYATMLARAGCNPKLHQHLMGHSRLETTMRYYTDVDFEMASDFLGRIYPQKGKGKRKP